MKLYLYVVLFLVLASCKAPEIPDTGNATAVVDTQGPDLILSMDRFNGQDRVIAKTSENAHCERLVRFASMPTQGVLQYQPLTAYYGTDHVGAFEFVKGNTYDILVKCSDDAGNEVTKTIIHEQKELTLYSDVSMILMSGESFPYTEQQSVLTLLGIGQNGEALIQVNKELAMVRPKTWTRVDTMEIYVVEYAYNEENPSESTAWIEARPAPVTLVLDSAVVFAPTKNYGRFTAELAQVSGNGWANVRITRTEGALKPVDSLSIAYHDSRVVNGVEVYVKDSVFTKYGKAASLILTPRVYDCVDSDEGGVTAGRIAWYDTTPQEFFDVCVTDLLLHEGVCTDDGPAIQNITCQCSAGSCTGPVTELGGVTRIASTVEVLVPEATVPVPTTQTPPPPKEPTSQPTVPSTDSSQNNGLSVQDILDKQNTDKLT